MHVYIYNVIYIRYKYIYIVIRNARCLRLYLLWDPCAKHETCMK